MHRKVAGEFLHAINAVNAMVVVTLSGKVSC